MDGALLKLFALHQLFAYSKSTNRQFIEHSILPVLLVPMLPRWVSFSVIAILGGTAPCYWKNPFDYPLIVQMKHKRCRRPSTGYMPLLFCASYFFAVTYIVDPSFSHDYLSGSVNWRTSTVVIIHFRCQQHGTVRL